MCMELTELIKAGKEGVCKKRRKDQTESRMPAAIPQGGFALAGVRWRKLATDCLDFGKRREAWVRVK